MAGAEQVPRMGGRLKKAILGQVKIYCLFLHAIML